MLKEMKWFVWAFILLVFIPTSLTAQDFVYTNNDVTSANTVSAFAVDANGALSQVAGSPFATGGLGAGGGLYAANRIVVINDFLYAANTGSNSVSAFTIDPSTGGLTLVGTPVATDGTNNTSDSGISLAATPDGHFLYAGTTDGNITIYSIDSTTGALTAVGTAVSAGGPMASMKVTPNGKFLVAALFTPALTIVNKVAVLAIQTNGSLSPVTNSPFPLKSGNGYARGVAVNCASNQLFVGRTGTSIDVLSIGSTGQLTELSNSPFATGLTSNAVVALGTNDGTLFSSNQSNNTVSAFTVGSNGSLTVPGTTASAGNSAYLTGGLAVSKDGSFLYAADQNAALSTLGLGGSSPLILDSYTTAGLSYGLRSVAAYPAKACASSTPSSNLSASLTVTDGPPSAFDLEATLTLNSSLVIDPLSQAVTIQVGGITLNVGAGWLKLFQGGSKVGTYVFQGSDDGTNLKLTITALGQNQFDVSAYDKQVDVSSLTGSVAVTVGIGGNSASTTTTPVESSDLSANPNH